MEVRAKLLEAAVCSKQVVHTLGHRGVIKLIRENQTIPKSDEYTDADVEAVKRFVKIIRGLSV